MRLFTLFLLGTLCIVLSGCPKKEAAPPAAGGETGQDASGEDAWDGGGE